MPQLVKCVVVVCGVLWSPESGIAIFLVAQVSELAVIGKIEGTVEYILAFSFYPGP